MKLLTRSRGFRNRVAFRLSASNSGIYRWYLRNNYWPEFASAEHFASEFSKTRRGITFLQLGSGTSVLHDPINRIAKRDAWKGLVIEPSGEVFRYYTASLYGNQSGVTAICLSTANGKWHELISEQIKSHRISNPAWLQINSPDAGTYALSLTGADEITPEVFAIESGNIRQEAKTGIRTSLKRRGYEIKQLGGYLVAALNPDEYLSRFLHED